MYELKKIGRVFMSKFFGNGPSSYKKIIYWAVVSQRLRNAALDYHSLSNTLLCMTPLPIKLYYFSFLKKIPLLKP
jgi:hypothetical protein